MLINRVLGPSCVVAPAIGHKFTFLWEVPRMGLGVPFALFPIGFFCCCYFKISVSLPNYLLV
jgi:hypothetical protein